MKILIEQSGHHLSNMGDVAMLQIAVTRLQKLWNNAEIHIITTDPELLAKYCPNTHPFLPSGRNIWSFKYGSRNPFLNKIINYFYTLGLDQKLRRRSPHLMKWLLEFILRKDQKLLEEFQSFNKILFSADLVMATGGGYINDVFLDNANGVINTLELGVALHKKTAIVGVGLGPLKDADTIKRAKAVFPYVDIISLREKRASVPLLHSFGVTSQKYMTTGDDAIELVYQSRTENLGNGIGVNLRISNYSNLNMEIVIAVKNALHRAVATYSSSLVPVPISRHLDPDGLEDPDSVAIQQLIEGYTDQPDGGWSLDSPAKVIKNAGLCRLVVTASYHAAVFALSQGVPVVGLAKSEYYVDKFVGLADQFGVGVQVVFLNDGNIEETLFASICHLWEQSENLRPQLLNMAKQQIELGHAAYQRIYDLTGNK